MFINKGTDELILKSLQGNPKVDQEELQKALDKSKLVLVERTVNGKYGTYRKGMWISASEVKKTDIVVKQQPPKETKPTKSVSDIKSRLKDISKELSELTSAGNNNPKENGQLNSNMTPEQKKKYDSLIEENANLLSELAKIEKPSKENSNLKDVQDKLKQRDEEKAAGKVKREVLQYTLIKNDGDSQRRFNFETVGELKAELKYWNLPESLADFNLMRDKDDAIISHSHGSVEVSAYLKPIKKEDVKASEKPETTVKSTKIFVAKPETKAQLSETTKAVGRDKLLGWAKTQNLNWVENPHEGINWMRASMAIAQAVESGTVNLSKVKNLIMDEEIAKNEPAKRKSSKKKKTETPKSTPNPAEDSADLVDDSVFTPGSEDEKDHKKKKTSKTE